MSQTSMHLAKSTL